MYDNIVGMSSRVESLSNKMLANAELLKEWSAADDEWLIECGVNGMTMYTNNIIAQCYEIIAQCNDVKNACQQVQPHDTVEADAPPR